MTTGNHTHDRPLVNWCAFWQVMAARIRQMMTHKTRNAS